MNTRVKQFDRRFWRKRPATTAQRDRRGSVLLVVLIIIVLLTLGVYTFQETSLAELDATNMFGRGAESRAFADSGIDLALTVLARGSDHAGESFYNRPDLFQGVTIKESESPHGRGHFSIVAPIENDATLSALRFGVVDESSKLNLNALGALGLDATQSHTLLMAVPGMTDDLADAILDWVDSDKTARFSGAESEYYQSLDLPYKAADGPMGSLDELLLVRGVTPELLFGEDRNQNGLIEPQEDNGDGIANLGWSAYFTVLGKESNKQLDGSKKINLNGKSLPELYDQIEKAFNAETAKFIIGFRMSGDRNAKETPASGQQGAQGQGNQQGNQQGSQQNSGNKNSQGGNNSSNGSSSASQTSTSGSSDSNSSNQNSNSSGSGVGQGKSGQGQGSNGVGKGKGGGQNQEPDGEKPTRGGIDLSGGAKITINSLYDLMGAEVEVTIDGEQTVLKSPWTADPGDIRTNFSKVQSTLSTNDAETIEGRINASQARREVLLGLPDMTEQIADAIIAASASAGGAPGAEVEDNRTTNGWLLADGVLTLEQMRKFDKFFTAKGDICRITTVGFFEKGGPVARLEAIIDTSVEPPLVKSVRDLTELGKGYSVERLMGSGY